MLVFSVYTYAVTESHGRYVFGDTVRVPADSADAAIARHAESLPDLPAAIDTHAAGMRTASAFHVTAVSADGPIVKAETTIGA